MTPLSICMDVGGRSDLSPGLSFTDLGLQGQQVLAGQLSLFLQRGVEFTHLWLHTGQLEEQQNDTKQFNFS